ncbi:MAG TPA: DUF4198 domain-containing protein [Noviherbaspirillum sp.]|jgi:hypothetical protein|uniref:DUF4198 domain-containing protein n=1 Tax=Noviherbaspirillum sp. TaxID=1926288 RepID=UPI002F92C264
MVNAVRATLPLRRLLLAAALATAGSAAADEVWLSARPFSPAAGAPVEISLQAGAQFNGRRRPLAAETTAALQLYSTFSVRDLGAQLGAGQDAGALRLTLANPGTHMLVYDSTPAYAVLPPGAFDAWLREPGLEALAQEREQTGTAGEPGRERVRRHAKILLRVGGKSDGTYGLLTGQRLEIVPTADPLVRRAGETLVFSLLFDSKPLENALVRAWHTHDGQTLAIRARTGAGGKVSLSLPYGGTWMIDAAHLVPAADAAEAEWDSFRSSLSFELPAGPSR